ncbi:MAG: capsid protein [Avonheates virus SG_4_10]|uniref:capsid protein n=1 Tax=Avonheates virus SG_4_10 TaxID=2914486 RepID=UPI002481CB34|nr:MAG: capsid protein [Avonheates virus SG_4_10]UNI72602.1 MAG: capsid protein [Avonheates virus SG_4_10]
MARKKVSSNTAHEVKNQLHVYHNPFSEATSQPKIPDGAAVRSLGVHHQNVREYAGQGILHMLMFPGMSSTLVLSSSNDPTSQYSLGRDYVIPGFAGVNGPNWSNFSDATSAMLVSQRDNYSHWRLVSAGLQLKLLNSQEEDDGWWESIRLTREHNHEDWFLTTEENSTNNDTDGTIAPVGLISQEGAADVRTLSLADESTYATGLLRDLHRIQFELHGVTGDHNFIKMRDDVRVQGAAINEGDEGTDGTYDLTFNAGFDDTMELIDHFVDTSYDMIYIRLHCRNDSATPSRFHVNSVMNHEVIFDARERESRYMTKSHNIGSGAAEHHSAMRKADSNSVQFSDPMSDL